MLPTSGVSPPLIRGVAVPLPNAREAGVSSHLDRLPPGVPSMVRAFTSQSPREGVSAQERCEGVSVPALRVGVGASHLETGAEGLAVSSDAGSSRFWL